MDLPENFFPLFKKNLQQQKRIYQNGTYTCCQINIHLSHNTFPGCSHRKSCKVACKSQAEQKQTLMSGNIKNTCCCICHCYYSSFFSWFLLCYWSLLLLHSLATLEKCLAVSVSPSHGTYWLILRPPCLGKIILLTNCCS